MKISNFFIRNIVSVFTLLYIGRLFHQCTTYKRLSICMLFYAAKLA
ncbi:hypothetical protein HMPREF0673_02658 [Leyella stercorea DSM 18206]|uniref:Uncharacterized protein n=1 Tax=Leyella stercorea DSM 18206 TaxID=1002367 RepID=G6B186_9BACT|nr:hypothetical protein HMPREF0673_02658 [Leyella stercorea DSM 18206]